MGKLSVISDLMKKKYIIYVFTIFFIFSTIFLCINNITDKDTVNHDHRAKISYNMLYNPETEQTFFYRSLSRVSWFVEPIALFGVYFDLNGNYKIRYLLTTFIIVYIKMLVSYIYKSDGKKRRIQILS